MTTVTPPQTYVHPGLSGSVVTVKSRYENFIGGRWVPPVSGEYTPNLSPATGQTFTQMPRSTAEDIERALDAAHAAKDAWGETAPAERARILNKVADAMEENLEMLAVAESWDNGKPVRETLNADLPLAIDHFRYFASAIRGEDDGATDYAVCCPEHHSINHRAGWQVAQHLLRRHYECRRRFPRQGDRRTGALCLQ